MNKDNATQFIPLVEALANGKTIQMEDGFGKWTDMPSGVAFGAVRERYRVKPEPPREFVVWTYPNGNPAFVQGDPSDTVNDKARIKQGYTRVLVREVL